MSGPFASSSIMAEAIALPVLCIIVVGLRFVARYVGKTQLRWDDWLIVPALVCL